MARIFCLLFLICIINNSTAQEYSNEKNDKLFTSWYNATYEAYNYELRHLHGEYLKSYAKKNTNAIKNQWGILTTGAIDRDNTRYLFLDVLAKFNKSNDFYVVEAILSGEYVKIENYIIYKTADKTYILRFIYDKDEKWNLAKQITIEGANDFDPYQYYLPERGTNNNNIIITHFKNDNVEKVFFYFKTCLDIQLFFNF